MTGPSSNAVLKQIEQTSTPLALLQRTASSRPAHPALICMSGPDDPEPRVMTFSALLADVQAAASAFRAAGIKENDSVALLLPPTAEAVVTLIAASVAGIVFPVNLLFSSDAMAAQLHLARAKVAVVIGQHPAMDINERLRAAADRVPSLETIVEVPVGEGARMGLGWQDFMGRVSGGNIGTGDPDRIGALFYTGGTTGEPKLAQLSLRNLAAGALMSVAAIDWRPEDRLVCGLPLFHVAGAIDTMLGLIAAGSTLIFPSILGARDPALVPRIWTLAERMHATLIGLAPTSIAAVIDTPIGDADLSRLRGIVTGGSALSPHLASRFEEMMRCPIAQVYGMTETSGIISTQPLDGRFREPAVGYPAPGLTLRLGPPETPEIESGEIYVKGTNIFQGYLTNAGTVGGGEEWVASGDLGEFGYDGQLRLLGRSKDIIIRSGHNIDPALIEEAAQAHPDVRQTGAVPMPDAYAGELPVLFVALRDGARVSEDEIAAFVAARIAEPPARPKQLFILSELPLTPVGKIARYKLRQMATVYSVRQALAGVSFLDINCDDPAAKRVEVLWADEPSDHDRQRAAVVCADLGLLLSQSTTPDQPARPRS